MRNETEATSGGPFRYHPAVHLHNPTSRRKNKYGAIKFSKIDPSFENVLFVCTYVGSLFCVCSVISLVRKVIFFKLIFLEFTFQFCVEMSVSF